MKRFLSIFLITTILFSSFVPVSATESVSENTPVTVSVLVDSSFVTAFDTYFSKSLAGSLTKSFLWSMMDRAAAATRCGQFGSLAELESACSALNRYFSNISSQLWLTWDGFMADMIELAIKGPMGHLHWEVKEHSEYGYVIMAEGTNLVFCTSTGTFPYYKPEVIVNPETGEESVDTALGGKWVRMDKIDSIYNVVNEATLYDLGSELIIAGNDLNFRTHNNKYLVIQSEWTESGIPFLYCDAKGRPYAKQMEEDNWAINGSNNYYVDEGTNEDGSADGVFDEGATENNTLIDLDSNTVWFPDGTLNYIENLLYDESTKTYYVDAHSEYDVDNNYYYQWNYHYEYHINYTSITYIGQSAEYDKHYELYYELPDGRNSADLTAEDLLALNTQIDVLSYIRSADDVSIRALYHFDGDLLDSSYWSHLGEFVWNKGASITYMDAGPFEGALYLDENAHDFSVKLPSDIGSGDFTLQFRLYQSHTLTPANDSWVSVGGSVVMRLNGSSVMNASSTALGAVSVGQWQELCVMRKNGVVYLYHNGVCIGSATNTTAMSGIINFVFGSSQQTYKYFDELRVVNKAIYSTAGYTPTAVPFDTNLALVLPDSQLPVADEYWSITSSGVNLLSAYGMDWFYDCDSSGTAYIKPQGMSFSYGTHSNYTGYSGTYVVKGSSTSASPVNATWPYWSYYSAYNSLSFEKNGLRLSSAKWPTSLNRDFAVARNSNNYFNGFGSYDGLIPGTGLFTAIGYPSDSSGNVLRLSAGATYAFSIVLDTGEVSTVTFTAPSKTTITSPTYSKLSLAISNRKLTTKTVGDYTFGLQVLYSNSQTGWLYPNYFLVVKPTSNAAATDSIVYMELVHGSSTDLKAEWVSSVVAMDKNDLNTPSLAVRTDIDITGYQVGGVRPSLPEKGLVWALVEGGRISSLQIYNGQAWEAVDGRIWTGERWVPYYAYDVLLMKDLYDVVEGDPDLDYIYTESGFWSWLQRAWGEMMGKLDLIIAGLGGGSSGPGSDCQHVYDSEVIRDSGCSEPGNQQYTCSICGHTYIELIDPIGHDWVVTNSVPDVLDEEGNVLERGYQELTCSVCEATGRDYGNGPEESDLFDSLGDLIAGGISWVLDKLTQLTDSLRGITEIFTGFTERMSSLAGGFPLFFGAFIALLPEDLSAVLWFALITVVILAVWKSWSK